MKKKILSLCLVVALALTAIGGTLAYFTDTDTETNTFAFGDVEIDLIEKDAEGNPFKDEQVLKPGTKTENNIAKVVTVENKGSEDAYMWIEVWIPSALDDGDDNSPAAPGKGNSLHFNYASGVTETKSTFLGSKAIGDVYYNGYVHYVKNDTAKKTGGSTVALLDQVYMDKNVTQCENAEHTGCIVLQDGTHYTGSWELIINAIGFQADGIDGIHEAIELWYDEDLDAHLWS